MHLDESPFIQKEQLDEDGLVLQDSVLVLEDIRLLIDVVLEGLEQLGSNDLESELLIGASSDETEDDSTHAILARVADFSSHQILGIKGGLQEVVQDQGALIADLK